MPREPIPKIMNCKRISKGNLAGEIAPFCLIPDTVWNRMRATASLTIPSPKMIEKSFGYSSYFTIDMAAMTSDEHKRDARTKLSIRSNSMA